MSGCHVLANYLLLLLTNLVQPSTPGEYVIGLSRGRCGFALLNAVPECLWVWSPVLILPDK